MRIYGIIMYLYNKNIFEYTQIARIGMESMIPDTEGQFWYQRKQNPP